MDLCTGSSPVYQCYKLGMLKKIWFVMRGERSSILHYGPLSKHKLTIGMPNAQWEMSRVCRYNKTCFAVTS